MEIWSQDPDTSEWGSFSRGGRWATHAGLSLRKQGPQRRADTESEAGLNLKVLV